MYRVNRNEILVARALPFILIAVLLVLLLVSLQVDHQQLQRHFAPTPALATQQ